MRAGFLLPGSRLKVHTNVQVPSSKSLTNRALIAAAVAGGGTVAKPLDCEDTRLLAEAMQNAGWQLSWEREISVGEYSGAAGSEPLHLGNSGTGARLILSLLACTPGAWIVDGTSRLRERPMQPLLEALIALGADLRGAAGGRLPVQVRGRQLSGGTCALNPGASSQFVTSLVMAAPLMTHGLELQIFGPVPSRPYLDLTEDVLDAFGAEVECERGGRFWRVAGTPLEPTDYRVEGDWSAAAFMVAAAAVVGGEVTVEPLRMNSRQGDRAVVEILSRAGVVFESRDRRITCRGPVRSPIEADLQDTPDLFPALAAVAAVAPPGSRLTGLAHLKHKESDRLSVMVANLRSLGAEVETDGSTFCVHRPAREEVSATRPEVTAAGDHRIAMAMAVVALAVGPLLLDDHLCVVKSFPRFWEQWAAVAGRLEGDP